MPCYTINMTQTKKLTARQTLRVMRIANERYSDALKTMTRAEYRQVLATIAEEIFS